MKKKDSQPQDDSSSSSGDDFNAMLTTEGMLQVEDVRSGKTADVRKLLGIKSDDIKNQGLKEHLKNYSVATSQPLKEGEVVEEIVDGAYFDGLNTLTFDMGTVGPDVGQDEEEKVQTRVNKRIDSTAWADWWEVKQKQNKKLQDAIIENSLKKVKALLEDEDVSSRADVNHNITF